MAGGNKSNSPKAKKRQLQDRDRAVQEAAKKKLRFSRPGFAAGFRDERKG
jgi:hypothetical protein